MASRESERAAASARPVPIHPPAPPRSTPKCDPARRSCFFLVVSCLLFGWAPSSRPTLGRQGQGGRPRPRDEADRDRATWEPLPPLGELVARNGTVVGDVSWMLDFAVVAFPKTGTTFMKGHLNQTSQTHVYEREFCIKRFSDVAGFVREYHGLHAKLGQPKRPKTVRFGLKCPGVFYRADDIHIYARYFPRTKLIVGLRHPISWFASFYNYQSWRNISLPSTSQLVGKCVQHQKVCTDRARFHAALARLGKTAMDTEDELGLLFGSRYEQRHLHGLRTKRRPYSSAPKHRRYLNQRHLNEKGLPNQVFLYEIREIHDEEASKELDAALSQYLGVREKFPPILSYEQTKPRAIDICDGEHERARRLLAEHGTDASAWIQRYLLRNPSVHVSSPISFHRYLDDWGTDPCLNNTPA